jgi:hypothetical protein
MLRGRGALLLAGLLAGSAVDERLGSEQEVGRLATAVIERYRLDPHHPSECRALLVDREQELGKVWVLVRYNPGVECPGSDFAHALFTLRFDPARGVVETDKRAPWERHREPLDFRELGPYR